MRCLCQVYPGGTSLAVAVSRVYIGVRPFHPPKLFYDPFMFQSCAVQYKPQIHPEICSSLSWGESHILKVISEVCDSRHVQRQRGRCQSSGERRK